MNNLTPRSGRAHDGPVPKPRGVPQLRKTGCPWTPTNATVVGNPYAPGRDEALPRAGGEVTNICTLGNRTGLVGRHRAPRGTTSVTGRIA